MKKISFIMVLAFLFVCVVFSTSFGKKGKGKEGTPDEDPGPPPPPEEIFIELFESELIPAGNFKIDLGLVGIFQDQPGNVFFEMELGGIRPPRSPRGSWVIFINLFCSNLSNPIFLANDGKVSPRIGNGGFFINSLDGGVLGNVREPDGEIEENLVVLQIPVRKRFTCLRPEIQISIIPIFDLFPVPKGFQRLGRSGIQVIPGRIPPP